MSLKLMKLAATAAIIGICALSTAASATVVSGTTFDYYTTGCFTNGNSCSNFSNTASDGGLSFAGTGTSNHPTEVVATSGNSLLVNLGSFSLSDFANPFAYNGDTFDLRVFFTAPTGVNQDPGIYSADVTGTFNFFTDASSATVDFGQTKTFTFNGGSFTLALGSLTLTNDPPLTGTLTLTAGVPEASTWAMMVIGFIAVGFFGYRRNERRGLTATC